MSPRVSSSLLLAFACVASGGETPIADLRLPASAVPDGEAFDPGEAFSTRSVGIGGFELPVKFSVASQNAQGTVDGAEDVQLKSRRELTDVLNFNRFKSSTDGGKTGPTRAGAAQWSIDLTPLAEHLNAEGLALEALDLDLVVELAGPVEASFNVLLSHDEADGFMELTAIDASTAGATVDEGAGAINWKDLVNPVHDPAGEQPGEGDAVGGRFRVLKKEQAGPLAEGDLRVSLLDLYGSGVREVNLIVTANGYWAGGARKFRVAEGSGVSMTTAAAEPEVPAEPE